MIEPRPLPLDDDLFEVDPEIILPEINNIGHEIKEQNWDSERYEQVHIQKLFLRSFEVWQAPQLIDNAEEPGYRYKKKCGDHKDRKGE